MMSGKKNGFTLIELLAVITIMGILMIVAIPAITRTIENARKDTFIDTVKQYVNGVKTMWASDNLQCGDYVSSAVADGWYYVAVDSSSNSVPQLLESGGKSPWGSRDIKGYILINVSSHLNSLDSRDIKYYPIMLDGIHGVNINISTGKGLVPMGPSPTAIESDKLKRGNLVMSSASYDIVTDSSTGSIKLTWEVHGSPLGAITNCVEA